MKHTVDVGDPIHDYEVTQMTLPTVVKTIWTRGGELYI